MRLRCVFVVGLTLVANPSQAQMPVGSSPPRVSEVGPAATSRPVPVLEPAEALRAFKVAPGFEVKLVASEPMVDHPVSLDVDPRGRLWVVEMPGFMKDVNATGLKAPTGRVVILEDTDGDGAMDRRTVFLEGLTLPRAIKTAGTGALVGEPPNLWYCPDDNGDGKADGKVAVTSDFFLRDDNPELGPNGPVRGLDNWYRFASYATRVRLTGKTWIQGSDIQRGQWGIAQDDAGRIVFNNNHDQLRGDFVPAHYSARNPNSTAHSGVDMRLAEDQEIWPGHPTPHVNEAHKPEILREDGSLIKFTAACGPVIYRGDSFGRDYVGNAFVCEPAANLVHRNRIKESGLILTAEPAARGDEFLTSTDTRFRPVNLFDAPDGGLLVVDMYKGVLIYKAFMTKELSASLVASQMADPPRPLGRIYKIVPKDARPAPAPRLDSMTTDELIKTLGHRAGWWRDTAQRILVERGDPAAVEPLRSLVRSPGNRLARLHGLWTLEGLGALDGDTVLAAMADSDRKLRLSGVRTAEGLLSGAGGAALLARVVELATDRQREVRVQVAFSLGESRSPTAWEGLLGLLRSNPGDIFLVDAVLSSLRGRELEMIEALLADPSWASQNPGKVRTMRTLAQCVLRERDPVRVGNLLGKIAGSGDQLAWQQVEMLDGVAAITRSGRLPPIVLSAPPEAALSLERSTDSRVAALTKDITGMLTWAGKPKAPPPPPPVVLTAAQEARADAGRRLFAMKCASCHQSDGMGMQGQAPPLLASEWVVGPPAPLVKTLLNGLIGPIAVHGADWLGVMPSFGALSDEEVASLATYVRRAWGNAVSPVDPALVRTLRQATASRRRPWTALELFPDRALLRSRPPPPVPLATPRR